MKEYVRVFLLDDWRQVSRIEVYLQQKLENQLSLVSEVFTSQEEAEGFAKVFAHNYDCHAYARRSFGGGYVVFMNKVYCYRVLANFKPNEGSSFSQIGFLAIGGLNDDMGI